MQQINTFKKILIFWIHFMVLVYITRCLLLYVWFTFNKLPVKNKCLSLIFSKPNKLEFRMLPNIFIEQLKFEFKTKIKIVGFYLPCLINN